MSGLLLSEQDGIEYRILQPSDRERLTEVYFHFLRTELSARSANLTDQDMAVKLDYQQSTTLSNGLSIAAVEKETGKIIGMRFARLTNRDDPPGPTKRYQTLTPGLERMLKIYEWHKVDVFAMCEYSEVDSYVFYCGLAVLDGFSGRGIGRRLCVESVTLMERLGYALGCSFASHAATRRIYKDLGFMLVSQVDFEEIRKDVQGIGDTGVNAVLSFHTKKFRVNAKCTNEFK